ncbi:N-acetyltransferase family protein [Maribacter litoralis]|uniref:GNAT family N-acetyltransferase n=1 Tax=Maribacter litoralis TaxID=2059726 RepID=UPI003D2AF49E
MIYRKATAADVADIATLHAKSWQQHYRASFSAHFLDHLAFENRLKEWENRFQHHTDDQFVLLAEDEGELLGFMCAYFDHDDKYGTLLDNLHVSLQAQGKGIGTKLMTTLAQEILAIDSGNNFYLWVLDTNAAAIAYYEKVGGFAIERVESNDIGDKTFVKIRYYWDDASQFLDNMKDKTVHK